jgi:hypothetical protein
VLLSWPLINMETENEDPLPDQISPILTPDFQALFESGPGLYLVLTPASTMTMIYTHVLNRGGRGVQSPADRLPGRVRLRCYGAWYDG